MKFPLLIIFLLLLIPFANAIPDGFGYDDPSLPKINSETLIGGTSGGGGGNSSINQSYLDANYWRLDNGNSAQLSSDWDMHGFAFSDVGSLSFGSDGLQGNIVPFPGALLIKSGNFAGSNANGKNLILLGASAVGSGNNTAGSIYLGGGIPTGTGTKGHVEIGDGSNIPQKATTRFSLFVNDTIETNNRIFLPDNIPINFNNNMSWNISSDSATGLLNIQDIDHVGYIDLINSQGINVRGTQSNIILGDLAFPFRAGSTNSGAIQISNGADIPAGLFMEVDDILSYAINVDPQQGGTDNSRQGAIFRMDMRDNAHDGYQAPFFIIYEQDNNNWIGDGAGAFIAPFQITKGDSGGNTAVLIGKGWGGDNDVGTGNGEDLQVNNAAYIGGNLNVTGTIRSNAKLVCLSDGTNCPAATSLTNVAFLNNSNQLFLQNVNFTKNITVGESLNLNATQPKIYMGNTTLVGIQGSFGRLRIDGNNQSSISLNAVGVGTIIPFQLSNDSGMQVILVPASTGNISAFFAKTNSLADNKFFKIRESFPNGSGTNQTNDLLIGNHPTGSNNSFIVSVEGNTSRQIEIQNPLSLMANNLYVRNSTNSIIDTCTLVSGACTIANTQVTAKTIIFCGEQTEGGTMGNVGVSSRIPGTSYNVTGNVLDTSAVACILMQPIS